MGFRTFILPLFWAFPLQAELPKLQFTDVTEEVVDRNPPGLGNIFDYAFIDLNDDNLLDIVVNNHHRSKGSPIWLGTTGFQFAYWGEMPEAWMPIAGFHLGEVDQDGDGRTDLICTGNEGGVVINLNRAEPGSRDLAYESVRIKKSSHLVSFLDLDVDGKLETFVRPGLIFQDLKGDPIHTGVQFGNWAAGDFNGDGLPDLFAAGVEGRWTRWNGPRKLFKNEGGTLVETGSGQPFLQNQIGGIPKVADFNQDGHFDLYLFGGKSQDGSPESVRLLLGEGSFHFKDATEAAGFSESKQKTGYSHVYLADLDNDTHVDIINQGNYGTVCLRNQGDGTFQALPKAETKVWATSSHLRFDDFDMDGKLDIVTGPLGPKWKDRPTTIRVFRNTSETANGWLKLKLRQTGGNPMSVGAVVTVYAAGTEQLLGKQMLYADTEGYHPRLHFGLAGHKQVDVTVRFPTTRKTVKFPNVCANQYLTLHSSGRSEEVVFPTAN